MPERKLHSWTSEELDDLARASVKEGTTPDYYKTVRQATRRTRIGSLAVEQAFARVFEVKNGLIIGLKPEASENPPEE